MSVVEEHIDTAGEKLEDAADLAAEHLATYCRD